MKALKQMKEEDTHSSTPSTARRSLLYSTLLILTVFAIFIALLIWSKLTLTDESSIGSFIGGITAPIVGILGAFLVFLALNEQVKANKLVQEQIDKQSVREAFQIESAAISQLYNSLKSSIDGFNYFSLDTYQFGQGQYVTGSEAIYKLFHDFYCDCHINESELSGNPKITELISILEICSIILEKLSTSTIPDKEFLEILTKHQFRYRIYPKLTFDVDNLNKHYCNSCNKDHGLPDNMVELIKKLDSWTK